MVPTLVPIMNPLPDGLGSFAHIPSHGRVVNEDVVLSSEPLEPVPPDGQGKIALGGGLSGKKKRLVVSIESNESIPGEGLMADARHAGREEEFFIINPGADLMIQLVDVVDHCRQLPLRLRLCLPIQ